MYSMVTVMPGTSEKWLSCVSRVPHPSPVVHIKGKFYQLLSSEQDSSHLPCPLRVQSLIRVLLFATLWTAAARLLCPWDSPGKNTRVSALSSCRGSSLPRDTPISVSCIGDGFFITGATWKPPACLLTGTKAGLCSSFQHLVEKSYIVNSEHSARQWLVSPGE